MLLINVTFLPILEFRQPHIPDDSLLSSLIQLHYISYIFHCVSFCKKEDVFTFHFIRKCFTLLLKSEEADFQLLYIAVALNSVIYFHSYVLYVRYILGLLLCISDCIYVFTYGGDDETLIFRF